jgi:hypothetical protein
MPMDVILSGSADEFAPRVACGVDDRVVVFEDGVESQFRRRDCQTFSTGFSCTDFSGAGLYTIEYNG